MTALHGPFSGTEPALLPPWGAELISKPQRAIRPPTAAPPFTTRTDSIADEFCATNTWAAVLEPHGWHCRSADPEADGAIWLHPEATSDCSATIRHGCLFVYSTNTPFEVTSAGDAFGYTKFRAYAVLEHAGDLSAAWKHLGGAEALGNTTFDPGALAEVDAEGQPTQDAIEAHETAVRFRAMQIRVNQAAQKLVDAEQRPKIEYPPVRSLRELLTQPCPPTRWRIDGVAPIESRIIMSAQFKSGKTTLTGNLIRSLADREPFLGRFAVHSPARSLVLIDNELSEHMVQDWLGRQGIRTTDAVADVVTLRGKVSTFNLFDDDCRAVWAKRFRDLGCDYLVLDCLRPILDAFGLDENRDAGVFLVKFDSLLEQAGIRDALIVHHMGHSGERSRGDSRLLDWPDANWRLVREDEDPSSSRFFSAYGRDVAIPEGRLAFNEATRHLTYVDGSRGDVKVEAALQAVIAALVADARTGGGGLSGRGIEYAVSDEHTQKSIRDAIKLASRRELVIKAQGLKNATLHRIARPCSMCGYPLAGGQGLRHESCAEVAA